MGRRFEDEEVQNLIDKVPFKIVDKGGKPFI